ncbi:MAG: O-methyltransferase [Clostridiales bacterium]|mgnify:CR=1 FL=1|jgi:predicted O-methyltransferase YrrM|nr:O-methyltransferase [Clostridiales bacterium]
MLITDKKVTDYINSLYKPKNIFLEALRAQAEKDKIPIILRDTETLLSVLLEIKRPKRILEIGTAIGYSAIYFAYLMPDAHITTLELKEKMQRKALLNIKEAGFADRIKIILGDALETLSCFNDEEPYDFIFIDGAKGHYKDIFDSCLKIAKPGTVIVSDNILYRAMIASDDYLDNRRNKTIVNRMREYLKYITAMPNIATSVLAVGDGVAISVVKEIK